MTLRAAGANCIPFDPHIQEIQERIKKLDFQNCKVRISNVDSQESNECIVIQAIGEICNKGGEPKKFVQTFVLDRQPTGYYVLNDILRYIDDETEDEEPTDEPATGAAEKSAVEMPAAPEAESPPDAVAVDSAVASGVAKSSEDASEKVEKQEELEEDETEGPSEQTEAEAEATQLSEPASQQPAASADTSATSVAPETQEPAADLEVAAKETAEEAVSIPEKPKEPAPTPVQAPAAQPPPPAEPEKPKAPAKPMTWAGLAAKGATTTPKPVLPLTKAAAPRSVVSAAPAQPPAQPTAAAASAPAEKPQPQAQAPVSSGPRTPGAEGWQTAGADSKRQNRQSMAAPADKDTVMGYAKYVTDKVGDEELRAALAKFGELTYFDINRGKVSAVILPFLACPYFCPVSLILT